jgi:hypothetical protein
MAPRVMLEHLIQELDDLAGAKPTAVQIEN